MVDGIALGDGEGIAEGIKLGRRVVGSFVGLGEGIKEGLLVGI